jgi:hypothetical protein
MSTVLPMATPPPPGTIQRGELLVDAQTRTLWLGVDATLDPTMALLVSDIVGMQNQIDALEAELRSYIDAEVAKRALLVHQHSWQDITSGTPPASTAGSVPALCIIMYSGSLATIPTGYVICDGTNNTPDLREKFVMGYSSNYPYKTTGGTISSGAITTSNAGNHSHGGATVGHAITWGQMPWHDHGVADPGHAHSVADYGHQHLYTRGNYVYGNIYSGGSAQWHDVGAANGGGYDAWSGGANQNFIGIYGAATGIGIYGAGGNEAHAHTIYADGGHTHTVTMSGLPPYFTLAFLMKLP